MKSSFLAPVSTAIVFTVTLLAVGSASAQDQARNTWLAGAVPSLSPESPAVSLKKIYSNLGPAGNVYDGGGGWIAAGPKDTFTHQQQDVALPFTPAKNSTVTQIKVPFQYYSYGVNAGTLALYSDALGLPGKALAKLDVTNLPVFGVGCCKLKVWTLKTGIHVKAGKQYWIVATTDKPSIDSAYVWDYNYLGTISPLAVQDNLTGWSVLTFLVSPAASVYGTIP